MDELFAILNSVYPLSDALRHHLLSITKSKEISKKEHYLRAGQINREICFVRKGLLRCYKLKRGREICTWFMKEGDFFVSIESYYDQVRGEEYVQAQEDCELYYISFEELNAAYRTHLELNFIGRELTIAYLKLWNKHQNNLRMNSARERYQYLLDHFSDLIKRVPSKYIASFLAISPITLSKIKGMKK